MLPPSNLSSTCSSTHSTAPIDTKHKLQIKHVFLPQIKQTACNICKKTFGIHPYIHIFVYCLSDLSHILKGVRKRHRKRTCKRCGSKVCEDCSIAKRWDFRSKELVRTCDNCIKHEHHIKISHRINNLKLKSRRNKGIYVAKTSTSSREYKD